MDTTRAMIGAEIALKTVLKQREVSHEEVLYRIESLVLSFVEQLTEGHIAPLSLANGSSVQDIPSDNYDEEIGSKPESIRRAGNKRGIIKSYFRTWAVMSNFYRIFNDELSSGVSTQSTLRDVYYTMKPKELFNECTSGQVSKIVSDVATILDCSRDSLKIRPSSHGMVFGRLAVQSGICDWIDCEESSVSIQVLYDLLFNENKNVPLSEKIDAEGCQYLLLVEKEGVMASLIESNFHRNFIPGIMICSQGVPDLCTRQVAYLLHQYLGSNVPVIALTDYNPGGLVILTTFKFGSENLGFDGMKYTIPTTGWLGIRARDILETNLPSKYFECLTSRDYSLLNTLAEKPFFHSAEFKRELSMMQIKVQIEAFNHFGFDFFPRLLAARIQQQEWIV